MDSKITEKFEEMEKRIRKLEQDVHILRSAETGYVPE